MNFKAVVIGDAGINSLGIIRSLGEKKIKVDAIITEDKTKNRKCDISVSRYVSRCAVMEKDENAIISELISMGRDFDKIFVFPTSDYILGVLSDNASSLDERFFCPSVSETVDSVKEVMSKALMAELAEKAGFDIPVMEKYTVPASFREDDAFFEKFRNEYPLIIKSDSINLPGCDFKIVHNPAELTAFLQEIIGSTVIVQKFIENAEEVALQGIGYGNKKEPDFFGIIHKLRLSVFALGTTSYAHLKVSDDEKLIIICSAFLKLLCFSGICDIELLVKGEKYYFIECNYRNGSYGYSYTKMGANLPYLWLLFMNGDYDAFNAEKTHPLKDLLFINDFGDVAHVLKKEINIFKWGYQYITAGARLSFNIKDPRPFFTEFSNMNLLKKLKRH